MRSEQGHYYNSALGHISCSLEGTEMVAGWVWNFLTPCFGFLFVYKDVTDTPTRKKRSSSHREEGETTETYVAQMTVFDKNR